MAQLGPESAAPRAATPPAVERRTGRDRRRRTTWVSLGLVAAASLALAVKWKVDLHAAASDLAVANALASSRDLLLAERDSLIARLTDPAMQVVVLAATGSARPVIKAYLDRPRRAMLLSAASLDSLPRGQTYQLWFIVGGKPVPSVTFKPGRNGRALVDRVPMPPGAVTATAVTKEPDGGSTTPAMPFLFMGKAATE